MWGGRSLDSLLLRKVHRAGWYFPFQLPRGTAPAGSWGLFFAGADHYLSIIVGILLIDIGMQCIQLSNQATLFSLCPSASNRINTIFMCCYFIGGSFGTLLSGMAWTLWGWAGVVGAGALLTSASLVVTLCVRR